MEYRDIRAVGIAAILAANALTMSESRAAQSTLSTSNGIQQTEQQVAVPRARPDADARFARLQDGGEIAVRTERAAPTQIRLPRPRPVYFDLRIDMTDMLGEEALAGLTLQDQLAEARRPLDDLQDLY